MADQDLSTDRGIKTAVAELHDPAAPVPGADDGKQMALLPLPLDGNAKSEPLVRGRGRPPGAKNKNTEAWREFLLAQYRSPLEALAQTYCGDVETLARRLCCTKLEAFKLQIAAAKELAPYMHQKQPLALDTGGGGLIQLNIHPSATAQIGADSTITALEILQEKDEENQLLDDDDLENSNAAGSNAEGQAIDIEEEYSDATA